MKRMKTSGLFLVLVMLVSSLTFQSCSKYEEGPSISLRSKKARLVNKWKIDKMYKNGTEYTPTTEEQGIYSSMTFEFKDDNTFVQHVKITNSMGGITYTVVKDAIFDWDFNSDKTKVLFSNGRQKTTKSYNGQSTTNEGAMENPNDEAEILKLKNSELKLKFKANQNGDDITIEFIPAD